jgi:hypothetical protein
MEALNLCRASVYKLIKTKELRTYRVGRRRMASHNALVDLIRAREAEEEREEAEEEQEEEEEKAEEEAA